METVWVIAVGLWSTAIGLALAGGWALWHLRRYGLDARLVSVQDFPDLRSIRLAPDEVERVQHRFRGESPTALLRQVVDSVARVEAGPDAGPAEILAHLGRGGGLLCGGMARLFAAALEANGIESRVVFLSRNFPDPSDSHVTVEVREEGRWVIYDPTFNLSVVRGGRRLGAEEVQQSLIRGGAEPYRLLFHPAGKYPARLERQAVDWLPLFNNVYLIDRPEGRLAKLPPLRYWLGPRILVKTQPGHPNRHVECLGEIYRVACLSPGISLALLALGAVVLFSG